MEFILQSEGESLWAEADAIAVAVGKDEVTYSKSASLQVGKLSYYYITTSLHSSAEFEFEILFCNRSMEFETRTPLYLGYFTKGPKSVC